jgi:hypothetical protein
LAGDQAELLICDTSVNDLAQGAIASLLLNGCHVSQADTADMTGKTEIVRELGEQALLLPTLLADALEANDRLKLRLTLLQEAAARARDPNYQLRDFHGEREAAGLADPQFDMLVVGARAFRRAVAGAGRKIADRGHRAGFGSDAGAAQSRWNR